MQSMFQFYLINVEMFGGLQENFPGDALITESLGDLLSDLSDSDVLTPEDVAQVDLAPSDAQSSALRDPNRSVVEGGRKLARA